MAPGSMAILHSLRDEGCSVSFRPAFLPGVICTGGRGGVGWGVLSAASAESTVGSRSYKVGVKPGGPDGRGRGRLRAGEHSEARR